MSNIKHCPHCHSTTVVKFGRQNNRRRYRCKQCGRTWQSPKQNQRLKDSIWHDYAVEDFRLTQLSHKYRLCKDKIRSILNTYVVPPITPAGQHDVVCMDCTYFGRRGIDEWGLLVIVDAYNGEALYCAEIPGHETYAHYINALNTLQRKYDITPKACVIDGVVGLAGVLERRGILVQYCQFHQIKTVLTYITRNPVLEPNKELKQIVTAMTHVDRKTFRAMFNAWFYRNRLWLNERTRNPDTGKLEYTHRKTRSAVHSLQRNFQYLYTFEQHPELKIPNTNNLLEGLNSAIKHKLNHHRGAKKHLKTQLVRVFLSRRTGVKNN